MARFKHLLALVSVITLVALLGLPVLAQDTTVQVVEDDTLGRILTDSEGMTLYIFTGDEPGTSLCIGQCAVIWPPLTVDNGDVTADNDVPGTFATIEREDGTLQVTYNGRPLYTYANDAAAGDTTGQGVNNVWFVAYADAPLVEVGDQEPADGTVTIDRVVAPEPGWLVIHADDNGAPGAILGQTAVDPGENTDVAVEIDQDAATETVHAMLHADRGTMGEFEFPGTDVPVTVDGQAVVEPFTLGEAVVAEQVTPTATPDDVTPTPEAETPTPAPDDVTPTPEAETPTPAPDAATATPTPAPALPVTGGASGPDATWPLTLMLLGGLVLIGGAGLTLALQRVRDR